MNNDTRAPSPVTLPVEGMHCASCVGRIEAGGILIVVDGPAAELERVDPQIAAAGGVRLPFEAPSAAS